MNTARKNKGLTMHSSDTLHRLRVIMVLMMIRQWRLVLVIRGQESQNYSNEVIRLESTKIRWFS
jgi:hypothetical protein